MNRAPLIFLGIFFAIAFSWTGIILTNHLSYAKLQPVYDEGEGKAFPEALPGNAQRGAEVYRDLGCVYCHTQQVRHPGYGTDIERGWGERGSVARDYIHEKRVYLGTMRTGPDLRNVGARFAGEGGRNWHIQHFYNPAEISKITLGNKTYGSIMPPYRFLFETRPIIGEPSPHAVQHLLPEKDQPPAGHEIVLTQRGEDLIAYLLSLKDPPLYPEEAKRVYVPKAEEPAKADAEAQPEAAK
jgi:Cbb3-type cytochrome oxidase, cytochrome c subunit